MKYFTYILYSKALDKYYKGYTRNIESRLEKHNSNHTGYTSAGQPWILVLALPKSSRIEAMKLELKLKNLNRKRLEDFIERYG